MQTISNNDIDLLKFCLEEKAQSIMSFELKVTNKTIIDRLHKLERTCFLKLTRTEASHRGGKNKNFWQTTEKGRELIKLLES
jgi:DNA-binding PadR family transcriptional regulator